MQYECYIPWGQSDINLLIDARTSDDEETYRVSDTDRHWFNFLNCLAHLIAFIILRNRHLLWTTNATNPVKMYGRLYWYRHFGKTIDTRPSQCCREDRSSRNGFIFHELLPMNLAHKRRSAFVLADQYSTTSCKYLSNYQR